MINLGSQIQPTLTTWIGCTRKILAKGLFLISYYYHTATDPYVLGK